MHGKAVFISYSHDSAEHQEKVLRLAERLRQDGLDAQLDQYVEGTPEQGWARWTLDRLDEADYVLVVCTETYYRRFRGHEVPGRGKGADWEGALITQEISDARSRTVKFVPLLLAAGQEPFIPEPLREHTHYELTSEERYQALYRFLLGQARVEPGPLGDIRPVSRRAVQPLTFDPVPDPPSPGRRPAVGTEVKKRRSQGGKKAASRRRRPLLWLALPTLVLLSLVVISTFWYVPTRVQLDLSTARLAFTPGGEELREILNRSVPFSSLVIEDCNTAVFAAEKLEIADPQRLVPGTEGKETAHFPAAAWRELKLTDPVKLSCHDPAAKLTLKNPNPAAVRLGLLDRMYFKPGSQVVLAISPGREPALTLEVETPQDLNLALGPDLELVADFVKPERIDLPFSGDLQTYRARLPEGRRTFEITSSKHGLVLIVTPTRDQLAELFAEPLDLPLASVEVLEEELEGKIASPLRDKATLSYPDYPAVPAVTIEKDEAVGLGGLSQARLSSLKLDAEKGALRARFDGIAEHATSRAGAFATDRRLTLFHTFRYNWRSGLIAVAAAWLFSTSWAAFEVWKKLHE